MSFYSLPYLKTVLYFWKAVVVKSRQHQIHLSQWIEWLFNAQCRGFFEKLIGVN